MRMYLECIPCMFNQGIFAARQAELSPEGQKEVLDALACLVPRISMKASPPEIAVEVYRVIREKTGLVDPFAAVKRESNENALAVYPEMLRRVKGSVDPLSLAVQIAISGNIIDYGANIRIDLKEEICRILDEEASAIAGEEKRLFDLEAFRSALSAAREILYIGDNAGEIVFDRVLIETLLRLYPDVTIRYAVRGEPIINDVTLEDALAVGMDRVCEVVDSGSPAPGAVPALCSPAFRRLLETADLIISKGQGNYEALSGTDYPVFCLLRVKCPVIAADIPAHLGDVCLFRAEARKV
ncbi:MAG: DUF89 family protein [Spirochaetales bacterium]|nr:DUF89 family protein [Spirochaetales bacterium]